MPTADPPPRTLGSDCLPHFRACIVSARAHFPLGPGGHDVETDLAAKAVEAGSARAPFLPGGAGGKRTIFLLAGAFALIGLSSLASTCISLGSTPKRVLVMLHALSFVLGFGAVLSVMFCGLRVTLGKLTFSEAARTAVTVDPGIWLGFTLMTITGAFLNPDLQSPWVRVKLTLSFLACVNGILALPSMKALLTLPANGGLEIVPRPLRVQLLVQTSISQLTWWAMILISYLALRS